MAENEVKRMLKPLFFVDFFLQTVGLRRSFL